jgi:hypothetical protein
MRNKIHSCMAHRWNKTKKKTVLRIRRGRDQGRSSRSCSRERDREINGLIDVQGTKIPSAALQTIESAAESEIGPKRPFTLGDCRKSLDFVVEIIYAKGILRLYTFSIVENPNCTRQAFTSAGA